MCWINLIAGTREMPIRKRSKRDVPGGQSLPDKENTAANNAPKRPRHSKRASTHTKRKSPDEADM